MLKSKIDYFLNIEFKEREALEWFFIFNELTKTINQLKKEKNKSLKSIKPRFFYTKNKKQKIKNMQKEYDLLISRLYIIHNKLVHAFIELPSFKINKDSLYN